MKKIALILGLLLTVAASADQVCTNVYNPHTNRWEYQCVERDDRDRSAPVCHQEYDAFNNVWVTVCN